MTNEELKLEIVKAVFPVYKDITVFMRIADSLYKWIAPNGIEKEPVKKIKENKRLSDKQQFIKIEKAT